ARLTASAIRSYVIGSWRRLRPAPGGRGRLIAASGPRCCPAKAGRNSAGADRRICRTRWAPDIADRKDDVLDRRTAGFEALRANPFLATTYAEMGRRQDAEGERV